ncbi:MAG: hypothetical protein K1X28_03140 [Parachlamydiales bacterium]|nr:hypothetical protein [Parachlamydiales bacterium]
MEIQSIRSTSKPQTLAAFATHATSKPETSNSTSTSWKRFASEATSYRYEGNTDLLQFYDQMQRDWEAGRFEHVVKGIDIILDQHLPALDALVRAALLTLKSKCYEEMGQMVLALIEAENAAAEIQNHKTFLDQLFNDMEVDPMNFLAMRKAGLMLHVGMKEQAFEILRSHQPKSITGVLVYHLLDKECKLSLLEPTPAADENDPMALFFAGRYEEVIEKTMSEPMHIRLHAAALAMAGRTEEALAYYDQMKSVYTFNGDEEIYSLIQALNGDATYPMEKMDVNEEFEIGFPVHLFTSWIWNQQA